MKKGDIWQYRVLVPLALDQGIGFADRQVNDLGDVPAMPGALAKFQCNENGCSRYRHSM
jgi:hypothetical protein